MVGGLHVDIANAQGGLTALFTASEKGHAECVRLLLEGGADANPTNNVRALQDAS